MNGIALALFAPLMLVLQSALAGRMEMAGVRPDWILAGVVFLGLYARSSQAVIGGLALGVGADLLTLERFGLLAVSYTLAGVAVSGVREFLFRFRSSTQFAVTLGVGVIVHLVWLLYRRLATGGPSFGLESLTLPLLSSVYTAVWAPVIHGGLLWAARWIGVPRPKYRFSEMHSSGMDA